MDEGTLDMAKAMVNMSIKEEHTYADITKSDMTVLGKVKMQDKFLRYRTVLRLLRVAAARAVLLDYATLPEGSGGGEPSPTESDYWGRSINSRRHAVTAGPG